MQTSHDPRTVSIVIVNYNGGAMLAECVRSALASTVATRVFVCDNASYDDSVEYLRSAIGPDERLTIVENPRNLGFARANNAVLARCDSDYVLFLNPDCVIRPDGIEQMVAAMDAHPNAAVAGCLILNPDGSEQPTCRRYIPTPWRAAVRILRLDRLFPKPAKFQPWSMSGEPLPAQPVAVEAVSGAFMFVRRSAMERVGYMDEGYFLHCEDLDWFMRFRQAAWTVLFVPHVRVVHWKGFSSQSHRVRVELHKHRGMARFYNKFFRERYSRLLLLAVMAAIWARFVAKACWIVLRSPVRLNPQRHKMRPAPSSAVAPRETGTPPSDASRERPAWGKASANPD